MSRITDLLKGAVELNLRYTSTLLHLSKDYLKDATVVLTQAPEPAGASASDGGATSSSRPPLLIVGHAGEIGNAAFAISNPSDREMNIHLVVQGELSERAVSLEPEDLTLKPGQNAIIRILVRMDDKLPVDRDYVGAVVAPGLIHQGMPFIVRRLADCSSCNPPAEPGSASHSKS